MPSHDQTPANPQAQAVQENALAWIERIKEAILNGDAESTMTSVKEAVEAGVASDAILKDAIAASMGAVGRDFKNGEFYIPDVLMCSRASHAALFALGDDLGASGKREKRGKVVVGTVAGDLHDIGKNIAALMLQCEQYEVIDLGIDVVPERFVEAVKTHKPDVLGISALLTTTINEMGAIIRALEEAGVRDTTHVYVSGLPVTKEFASSIGADHYCEDARDTLDYVASVTRKIEEDEG